MTDDKKIDEKVNSGCKDENENKNLRKFDRRTWRDRRRVWKNKNYKGPERRKTRKRRCSFDRRGVPIPDDLGKNIP